jgi:cobalt-zinc-cadmium efflux system membrane fusion protein
LPVRIRLANPDGALRIGMYVDVTVTSETGRDAVVVPSAAVQTVADKQVVFMPLGGGRFQSHDVTVGVERKDWVELRNGVPQGGQVVTQGSFELKALLQKSMLGGG